MIVGYPDKSMSTPRKTMKDDGDIFKPFTYSTNPLSRFSSPTSSRNVVFAFALAITIGLLKILSPTLTPLTSPLSTSILSTLCLTRTFPPCLSMTSFRVSANLCALPLGK